MAEAHVGLVRDPSAVADPVCLTCHDTETWRSACDACHASAVTATANSLHTNLWGEKKAIEDRCGCTFEGGGFEDNFAGKCGGCHTTCGQCHVSRPNSVGGGFPKIGGAVYMSHTFAGTPDMEEQCTACHGSRIKHDYFGEYAANERDVHKTANMNCSACHTKEEIHGDSQHAGANYEHRYEVKTMPRCEDCHGGEPDWDNDYHNAHVNGFAGDANLQCQVCHAQPYKNCTNCHDLDSKGLSEKFVIDPSVIQFKIAQNPSPHRTEYDFSVVRHTPIDPGTYTDWGLALPNYTDKSTWQYSSPHNVVRWTAQTTPPVGETSCSMSCHQTPDSPQGFFLRESDLQNGGGNLPDYDANIGIVIRSDFP